MSDTNASRPGFDPSNPAFRADPYPFYDELRQHDPVHRTPFDTIVLTRYEDVAWTLRSNDFSRDVEANGTEMSPPTNSAWPSAPGVAAAPGRSRSSISTRRITRACADS
ncbi:MAG: hypothetical protein EBS22_01325 [Acidimicrobiia bacterium]|nr:hypothetical protein [Acidimicrobiia bacterium]